MSESKPPSRTRLQQRRRRGVAATEFAVCLPIIVLLVLGTIEACSLIFLKQTLAIAEGAQFDGSVRRARDVSEVTPDLA